MSTSTKQEVFSMENQVFQKNTLEKVGIWSRGDFSRAACFWFANLLSPDVSTSRTICF